MKIIEIEQACNNIHDDLMIGVRNGRSLEGKIDKRITELAESMDLHSEEPVPDEYDTLCSYSQELDDELKRVEAIAGNIMYMTEGALMEEHISIPTDTPAPRKDG